MVKRTHTIEKKNPQHNQVWEWEETPELDAKEIVAEGLKIAGNICVYTNQNHAIEVLECKT